MSPSKDSPVSTQEEFDPIAYIESAFTTDRKEPLKGENNLDLEIESIGEFLGKDQTPKKARKSRTQRKSLSAPRPRRVRSKTTQTTIDPQLTEVWSSLPKNIEFLGRFFDDKVTANYYTGDFKESRQELIRRLLDPQLTLEEVSRLLGVCPATVRRYTNRNWLNHHRTEGGQRRFRLTDVVKFVEEHGRNHD
ncbi:MAG: helix-turn-helix domain-containing protein [Chthonomonas sp.]|nr:helix-turn-helix domain-containing protein [Chthonomonas sp.]